MRFFFLPLLLVSLSGCRPTGANLPPLPDNPSPIIAVWTGADARVGIVDPTGGFFVLSRVIDPSNRGPRFALSPDGRQLASLVLDRPGADPASDASVYIANLDGSRVRRLAAGADLNSAPIWSPDGNQLAVRRHVLGEHGESSEIWTLAVDGGDARRLFEQPGEGGIHLVDWRAEGIFWLVIEASGSELRSTSGIVQPLSDAPVRDVRISPSGKDLAFVDLGKNGLPARLGIAEIGGSRVRLLDQFGPYPVPAWTPENVLTVASGPRDDGDAADGIRRLTAPPGRIDIPVSWSPDGSQLVARSLALSQNGQVGDEQLFLLSADGRRTRLRTDGLAEPLGWSLR